MTMLFNPIEPFNNFFLKVDETHEIYVEEVGNKNGVPIIFVHGGPGGGISPDHRRYFDPKKFRVILFDQRGCGKSKPFGELKNNTTQDLVADMEKIRIKLGISSWHLFGGSWGSTLALAYAITHADKVLNMILRGIFLVRPQEIKWFYQEGASFFYPQEWQDFLSVIPKNEQDNLVKAYYKRLTSSNSEDVKKAAIAWSKWEGSTSKLIKDTKMIDSFSDETFSYAFARIECHYFINNAFFSSDNWILENIYKISHIKSVLIQGRYDMPCPPISAFLLHQAWANSKLLIIEQSGHSASEAGITKALLEQTNNLVN